MPKSRVITFDRVQCHILHMSHTTSFCWIQKNDKIYRVPRPGFGKNVSKKVFASLFFSRKKSSSPFFLKKKPFPPSFLSEVYLPPFYFLPKPDLFTVMKTTWCIYFMYHMPMNTSYSLQLTYFTPWIQKWLFWKNQNLDYQHFLVKKVFELLFFSRRISAPFSSWLLSSLLSLLLRTRKSTTTDNNMTNAPLNVNILIARALNMRPRQRSFRKPHSGSSIGWPEKHG